MPIDRCLLSIAFCSSLFVIEEHSLGHILFDPVPSKDKAMVDL